MLPIVQDTSGRLPHDELLGDYSGPVSPAESPNGNPADGFGQNEWMVDEIYHQYLADRNSVDPAWWDFFADYKPSERMPTPEDATRVGATSASTGPLTRGGRRSTTQTSDFSGSYPTKGSPACARRRRKAHYGPGRRGTNKG